MSTSQSLPFVILVVEDNDDDFEATERALRRNTDQRISVMRSCNGQEAWEFLSGVDCSAGANPKRRLPHLILLDLNMPGLDGRSLLIRIKSDQRLRALPVVILTTSTDPDDVNSCYQTGANSYMQKPVEWEKFCECIALIRDYWIKAALLPKLE